MLLTPPLGWLVVAYLGSLAVMLISSFYTVDAFTGKVVTEFSLDNYKTIFTSEVYRTITARTVGIAAAVTITDALIAFPIAFYMARVAGTRKRGLLAVSVLLPLWSSYLVKVYAWYVILAEDGVLNWLLAPFGLSGPGVRRRGHVARLLVPLAAVHDPADLRRPPADPGVVCSRRPATWGRRPEPPSGGSSCRSPSRPSWPARSSRSP